MHDQAVVSQLDERKCAQALEGVLRRALGQHRREQRERDPANDRGGVERLARRRLEDVEVELGQLVEYRPQCDVLERGGGARTDGGGRELEREWVSAGEPVHALRVRRIEPLPLQEVLGLALGEIPERQAQYERAPARRRVPDRDGGLAACQDEARVVAQRGSEEPADPAVEQAQDLVGVDDQHDALAEPRQALGRLLGARRRASDGASEGIQESRLGRLDRAAVDLHHRRARVARLAGERLQQRRLADAGDAVHEDDEAAALLERPEQGGLLRGPADDLGRPFLDELANRPAHLKRPSCWRTLGDAIVSGSGSRPRCQRARASRASDPRARRSRST